MIEIIIFVILCFLLISFLLYGALLILVVICETMFYNDKPLDFKRSKRFRKIVIPINLALAGLLSFWFLFHSPAYNLETAYIQGKSDKYEVTIYGKRVPMVHDLISAIKNNTYLDSTKFMIPRSEGFIDYKEIPNKPGNYKFAKGGIRINNLDLKVDLYYDNYDDKKLDASQWNGKYKLSKRK